MGRRKKGEKPQVRVTNHGGRLYARVRVNGRVHYLGRVSGELSDDQIALADALQNERGNWFVYLLSDHQGNFKIGVAQDVRARVEQLQTGNASPLSCVFYRPFATSSDAMAHEAACHVQLRHFLIRGEWFRCPQWAAVDAVRGGKARKRPAPLTTGCNT